MVRAELRTMKAIIETSSPLRESATAWSPSEAQNYGEEFLSI
jgi:hypothetical protein